jgi:hypothetical protein
VANYFAGVLTWSPWCAHIPSDLSALPPRSAGERLALVKRKLAAFVTVATLVLSVVTALSAAPPAIAAPPDDPDHPKTLWPVDGIPDRTSDNVILKWNEELLQAIRLHPPQTGPTITARAVGMLHTATFNAWAPYDAVAKPTLGVWQRQPADQRTGTVGLANKNKAISFAAYNVLVDLFPATRYPRIGEVNFAAQMVELFGTNWDADTSVARTVGESAAAAVIQDRHADGSNQLGGYANTTVPYTPKNTWDTINDPWAWQPLCIPNASPPPGAELCPGGVVQSPLTPHWKTIRPFALIDAMQFTAKPPAQSLAEVDLAVADAADNDVEKARSEYWADGPGSEFPPGHWAVFAQALSRKRAHSLDTDAKLFFVLGNALLDASITSWAVKYRDDFARPISAIRYFKKDQLIKSWLGPNQGFGMVPGQQWRPYQRPNVVTPAFPEYVSGHSTFSAAGRVAITAFIGNDSFKAKVTVRAGTSLIEPGRTPATDVVLSWNTFIDAARDAGISRRNGGIHFKSGDDNGWTLGSAVGGFVWERAKTYINGTASG